MSLRTVFAAVVWSTLAAGTAGAQQAVLLRYAPPVGQVTHYRAVSQTWMQVPGMGSADTTQPAMTQTMYSTRTVTAMDGAARVVTSVVDSSKLEMGGGMAPSGDMYRGMTTTQHVDNVGHVLSFELTPPPGTNPMIADAMRRRGGQRQFVLPERRVAPGATWTWSDTVAMSGAGGASGGHTILDLTYRLDKIERHGGARLATISATGQMHSDNAAAAGAMSGTVSEDLVFDLDAGRVTHETRTIRATVNSPQAGSIPMRSVTTTEALP
jgi:hypothetical protein